MSNEKHRTLRRLMDEAYGLYDELTTEDWHRLVLERLGRRHLDAVLLGNLNYQVCNGGFMQWVDNGYGLSHEATTEALRRVGTKNALAVVAMINRFSEYINDSKRNQGFFNDYWLTKTDVKTMESECYKCGGSGVVDDTDAPCPECDGTGVIEEECEEECSPGVEIATSQDDPFYDVNEELLDDVERYMNNEPQPESTNSVCSPTAQPTDDGVFYPHVRVRLTGNDGNTFGVVASVQQALRRARVASDEISRFVNEATSGDYNNVLNTCSRWVTVS